MRKLVIILLALVVVAGAVYWGSQRLLVQPVVEESTPATLQTGPSRSAMVRCRGRLVPKRWLALRFGTDGVVLRIAAQEGAAVVQGDLLAELVAADDGLAVRSAEQSLLAAQARLAQVQATPEPNQLRLYRARVAEAKARLDALRAGPTALELEEAQLRIDRARDALWGAQAARDEAGGLRNVGAAYDEAKARVAAAEVDVRLAELSAQALKAEPAPEALAAAEAQLAEAEANLATLLAGPAPEDVAVLKAAVSQAELALEQARSDRAKAEKDRQLYAPFAGTVTAIDIQEGEAVSTAADAIILADLSELQIETIDLSELDVAALRPEQPVEIAVAGSGKPIIQGRVAFISPQPTIAASGEAYYRVLVSLDRQDPALRWGMSADLSFGKRRK